MSTRTAYVYGVGVRTTRYGHTPKVAGSMITHLIAGGRLHYDELVTDVDELKMRNAVAKLRKKGFRRVSDRGDKTYRLCHCSPQVDRQDVTFGKDKSITLVSAAAYNGASSVYQQITRYRNGAVRSKIVIEKPNAGCPDP